MEDLYDEVMARVSSMRGESFTIDEEFDSDGEATGVGYIQVMRGRASFSIAYDIESQDLGIAGPPVLHALEARLAELRLLPYGEST